jgi:dTDP-L-rhamnose 4-epimerase
MAETVLVTGGAGFIGSHLVDALVAEGHRVRVYDNLEPQVHGPLAEEGRWPAYRNADAEYVLGDVRDQAALSRALCGVEVVYHLAAGTGMGQSMYQIARYVEVNVQGTANLLDALVAGRRTVRKLVLSSSRAVYGEGAYRCERCGIVHPPVRSPAQLDAQRWEVICPHCGGPLTPGPTPESLRPDPGSIYAITKHAQEEMCLCFGRAYGVPVTVLRYFNVYGPRQSPRNPYTGIITAFLHRLAAGQDPEVYEDGRMTRDFVHVSDATQANLLAARPEATTGGVFNVGSGQTMSILHLALRLCELVDRQRQPSLIGVARVGDVRHCNADITLAYARLGYRPQVATPTGLAELVTNASPAAAAEDAFACSTRELAEAHLLRGGRSVE